MASKTSVTAPVRRPRAEMIEATRAKLVAAARRAFAAQGFARTSMDEFTAQAGLTRGALHHHFGDKRGLLEAVVLQIDAEMNERLQVVLDAAPDPWTGFQEYCRAYLRMAQEPEIQRVVLRDARAVLGGASEATQQQCIGFMSRLLGELMEGGFVCRTDPEALACLLNGSLVDAAFWIAQAEHPAARLARALESLELLLAGLRPEKKAPRR